MSSISELGLSPDEEVGVSLELDILDKIFIIKKIGLEHLFLQREEFVGADSIQVSPLHELGS